MKYLLLIILAFASLSQSQAQSLRLYGVDASNYPTMKAKIYAFDGAWNQQSPSIPELLLTENGIQRSITNVQCPPVLPPDVVSLAMSIDISSSMSPSIDFAKITTSELCDLILFPTSEFALQICDDRALIVQDFTTNKRKITDALPAIVADGGNNFHEHLLNRLTGLLYVAKKGTKKKVAVLFTDAWWIQLTPAELQECKALCDSNKIQFIAVIYSSPEREPNGIKVSLQELANHTGGMMYDGVDSKEKALEIASKIQIAAQGSGGYCDLTWESGVFCSVENSTTINTALSWSGVTAKSSYTLPLTSLASLSVTPNFISFGKIPPPKTQDTTLTVTANNADFTITSASVNFGSTCYTIVNQTFPFQVPKNTSKTLTLRYTPTDSSLTYVSYQILSDKCSVEFSASGGYGGIKNKNPTLRLTTPNGGEEFLVGSDTTITWKGVTASDTVTLKYSNDKGLSWSKITDKATGLTHTWSNIPKPTSTQCLVKVQLKDTPPPSGIDWQKTFGGSGIDHATSIRQTNDGGYIVVGESESTDGDGGIIKGMSDVWILKLSLVGAIEWKRSYGGSRTDAATCASQTNDGGYIVGGYTESNDGDVKTAKGSRDAWILKLSKLGVIEWQKVIGGSKDDEVLSIEQAKDGSYIAAGWSESSGGDVQLNRGNADAWVIKLNANGSNAWQYTYGGTNADFAESIVPTLDGGYIFAGHSYSTNGDITNNKGFYDYWIVKLHSYGTIEWQKTYGGSGNEYAKSITQTSDSGYIVAGWSDSKNGDVSLNHGGMDYWVLKLGAVGGIEWQQSYGGSGSDYATSILQTSEGGYAVAGYTYSNDGDIATNLGGNDAWILKLTKYGLIEWQKTFGGSRGDYAASIQQTTDDGFVMAGYSDSKDNISGNKGKSDYWVIKLSSDGDVLQEDQSDAVFSIVAPTSKSQDIDMLQCVLGNYRDSLILAMVTNTGTFPVKIDSFYFRGKDAAAFELTSGIPPYVIPVAGNHSAEIRFIPRKIGIHTADVVIITQSDTLIHHIQGEGIAPVLEVLGSVIDFGNVILGKQKDTLHVATVRNVGTLPLTITGTRHIGPNDKDFSTISGGGNFTLQPNDTAFFDVRFAPQSIGRTSGRIRIDYNGVGSPATVTLFGTGSNDGAHILAIPPKFPLLVCDSQAIDTLTLRNTGIDTLRVTQAQFGGVHAGDFQFLTPFAQMIILPDSAVMIPVRFRPTGAGNRLANLEIRSNSREDSILLLPLSGSKESVNFTTSMQQWNVGILCPNEPKDTTITILYTGTLRNVLRMNGVNFVPGIPSITVQPNDTIILPVRLKGRAGEGVFDEILTITDSICGVRNEVHVIGNIKRTKIISQQVADFGSIAGGSSTELEIFAVNKDIRPIVIESPTGFSPSFTLSGLTPPAGSILAPNDTVKALIRFNAVKGEQTTGYLNWSVILPCPSMDSTELRGIGLALDTALTTVIAQDITAQAGEKVNLTLKLYKPTGMQITGAPTDWQARIHYNKSILFNTQTSNVCQGTTDSCVTILTGVYNSKSEELISIPCITTLGNTDHSTIVIDTFFWKNSAIVTEVATQNGTITLNGVCEDGGVRLFIPANSSTSLATRPNPAQDNLQIHYGLREPLTVTLELLTMTGQVVQTILSNQAQTGGQYTLTSDLSVLGNGVYLLRLRTNKEILTTRVDVVK